MLHNLFFFFFFYVWLKIIIEEWTYVRYFMHKMIYLFVVLVNKDWILWSMKFAKYITCSKFPFKILKLCWVLVEEIICGYCWSVITWFYTRILSIWSKRFYSIIFRKFLHIIHRLFNPVNQIQFSAILLHCRYHCPKLTD